MPSGPRPRASSRLVVVDQLDARLEVRIGLHQVEQPDAALPLHDGADGPVLEPDDLGDLGQGADGVELVNRADLLGLVERWVMSATGCEVRTARSSALTLRSRPTCSGTIISGKITVSRRATSGSTWSAPASAVAAPRSASISGSPGSCHQFTLGVPSVECARRAPARGASGPRRIARHRLHRTGRRRGSCRPPRAEG